VIEIIERDNLLAQVTATGEHLGAALAGLVRQHPNVALEARGRGLLRGLRVKENAAGIVAKAREHGVLFSLAGADVVRFAPAYVVTTAQIDQAVDTLGKVLAQ
jgi:acetylornithine/succinyldiaminopimelate/putrescine aminotransferase